MNKAPRSMRPLESRIPKPAVLPFLWGNIAKNGCVVKRSSSRAEMMVHEGPARVFDSEDDAIRAISTGKVKRASGRYPLRRPEGRPGMREMLNPTSALAGMQDRDSR